MADLQEGWDAELRRAADVMAEDVDTHAPGANPFNPADIPASWLPGATQAHPKPPAYQRAVARKVKNRRWLKIVDMAEAATKMCLDAGLPLVPEALSALNDRQWSALAEAAGHKSTKPPSPETRAAVIEKVRANLADIRAKQGGGVSMP